MAATGAPFDCTGAPPARNRVPGMSFRFGAWASRLASSEVGAFQETAVKAFRTADSGDCGPAPSPLSSTRVTPSRSTTATETF